MELAHLRQGGQLARQATPGLGIGRVLPHRGETKLGVPDNFVADSEAFERRDPGIDALPAKPVRAAPGNDACRVRRDTQLRGIGHRQHRCAGAGIELGADGLAVDRDGQPDFRARLDRHHAGGVGRPVRERYAFAIPGLIKPHRVVGQIEFDIGLMEKIVAEEEGDLVAEIVLAGDRHAPVLARSLTDPELVEMNVFGAGLATDAEGAIAFGLISGQPQLRGCRALHETHLRPGVEQDADLPAVDLAVDDGPVVFRSNRPLRDPCQLALGSLGGGVASQGEPDRGRRC